MNKKSLSFPYLLWAISFIVIPLLIVVYYAFTGTDKNFTLNNILQITNAATLKSAFLSLYLAILSTFFCLILAYPTALFLSRMDAKYSKLITVLLILPMWMNSLLRIISWMILLEKKGLINSFLSFLNLPALNIINTPIAIVVGMVYDFLPFMILPIYNSLCKIQKNTIEAAWDLGAGNFHTLTRIIIPLSLPGIVSGITMVFIPSLTTFAISDLLGGGKILLIGNVIEQQFKQLNDRNTGSGLSFVLMIFILISMAITSHYSKNMEDSIL